MIDEPNNVFAKFRMTPFETNIRGEIQFWKKRKKKTDIPLHKNNDRIFNPDDDFSLLIIIDNFLWNNSFDINYV